jgi:hypothetical protein
VMVYEYRFLTHNFVDADDIDVHSKFELLVQHGGKIRNFKLSLKQRTKKLYKLLFKSCRVAPLRLRKTKKAAIDPPIKNQEAIMTDEHGNPVKINVKVPLYDLQHKLIGSMMTNNERRKDDDGRIYDTGIFKFSTDMDQNIDETHVELKPLTIEGKTGQFISVGVQVDYKAVVNAKKTPSKAKKTKDDATIGTGKLNCILVCVCVCVCACMYIILSLFLFPHS